MFDYHMHSIVSFDGHNTGLELATAARERGLKEICFTDHVDFVPQATVQTMVFDVQRYNREYDSLEVPGLKIRRGMEFGLTEGNQSLLLQRLSQRHYDFVLGSVHFVDGVDVYYKEYWQDKIPAQAQQRFLEQTLAMVQVHQDFDVLAHMTFLMKSPYNPVRSPLSRETYRELIDEILRTLAQKGKGLEMNTSGVDRSVGFLPTIDFFRRFKELGGEIVTVGSDAHRTDRVGQYCGEAAGMLGEIFGYVCTFEDRQPIFHKM